MLKIDHAGITVGVRDMKVKAGGGNGRSAGVSPAVAGASRSRTKGES